VKNYLILYNITFFLFGNVLLSNLHHLSDHNHLEEVNECLECIYFDNNNYYIVDDSVIFFSNNYFNIFINEYSSFVLNDIQYKYPVRAPPTLL